MPDGTEACIADRRLVIPCGGEKSRLDPDVDVYGPIAFGGGRAYFASPSENGMLALWAADLRSKRARRISAFARDTYAPSISTDGTVVFKVQSYRTNIADVPSEGGATRQLATFQSETPSYHPTQPLLSFTYGTWRRQLDDGKYPDIAQDIGVIDLSKPPPASTPGSVIAKSESEDQAMTWSPNGKWIAFHSHREMSDDVWLRPADGSKPDQRVTFLGRGAEVGWPRWSPDGRLVLLDGARKSDGRSVLYTIGIDQQSGAITSALKEIPVDGITGDITHAEWRGHDTVVGLVKVAPGQHDIVAVPVTGGAARVIHHFETEHDFSGLGISPDGKYLAFTAPAADGYHQIYKLDISGDAAPIQLTSDPSNKTQPAFSPDGTRVAFTIWSYEAAFWSFHAH
jgi:Tol biopolymer transport system component